MTKRKRFIATSILLSLGFVGVQIVPDQFKILSITSLAILTLILFWWSLRESISWDMTLVSLFLPFFYTMGVGFFWFLLPFNIFARIPVVLLFGLGIYALCLTSNIYTVSAIRTIALLRAARGVGFVLTLLTFFLIFDTILSLRWWIFFVAPLVWAISIPLYFQGFWSFNLDKTFSKQVMVTSFISSIVMSEMAIAIFFWPVSVVVGSLFLTATAYMVLGLGQAELEGRLFPQTVKEYLFVGVAVFLGMLIATHWAG